MYSDVATLLKIIINESIPKVKQIKYQTITLCLLIARVVNYLLLTELPHFRKIIYKRENTFLNHDEKLGT